MALPSSSHTHSSLHLCLNDLRLAGVVACLPDQQVHNIQLTDQFPIDDIRQISKSTGVESRYLADKQVTTGDLCLEAAKKLLHCLEWPLHSVDGVILMTQTPNQTLPATACRIQHQLGLTKDTFAFDVNLGCSAYPYGLWLAGSLFSSGAKRILLLAGDTISHIVDPSDRATALLFGDAGTATALEKGESDTWHFLLGTDGSGADCLQAPQGGHLSMQGPSVFEFTLREVPPLIDRLNSILGNQHDYYLFHQANRFMIEHLRRKCSIPPEIFPINIGMYGNTSSASIPLLMVSSLANSLVAPFARIALVGYGVGLSWAAASLPLNSDSILETKLYSEPI
jgi:3-oxoacyl-[acyl-carrier-protein] synthase III